LITAPAQADEIIRNGRLTWFYWGRAVIDPYWRYAAQTLSSCPWFPQYLRAF
jgi:hypothetical protein